MEYCNDYGDRPGCLGEADPKYTMDFQELGKIYWCAFCGPEAHRMDKLLQEALDTRGPEFVKQFTNIIDEAKTATTKH